MGRSRFLQEDLLKVVSVNKLGMDLHPSPVDRARAYTLVKLYRDVEAIKRSVELYRTNVREKGRNFIILYDSNMKNMLVNVLDLVVKSVVDLEKLTSLIRQYALYALTRFTWARYLATLPYMSHIHVVCMVAYPPTVIYRKEFMEKFNYGSWICKLLPIKKRDGTMSKALTAKIFYTELYVTVFRLAPTPEKIFELAEEFRGHRKIKELIDRFIENETKAVCGKPGIDLSSLDFSTRRKIVLRVFRNIVRLMLDNTYLVSTWYLVKSEGVKKLKPPNNVEQYLKHDITPLDVTSTSISLDIVKKAVPEIEDISWELFR